MPRYIDADKLVAWCTETAKVQSTTEGKAYVDAFLTKVFSCPTADVVPKSEVERILNELWVEIRKIASDYPRGALLALLKLAELKKKYTEGE